MIETEISGAGVDATLRFKREELLYDIRNMAYVLGQSVEETDLAKKRLVQDICEEGNVDIVTRSISLAMSECREYLMPYSRDELRRTEMDDELREREEYVVRLRLPETYAQGTLGLVSKLIHDYAVSKALYEWLLVVWPEQARVFEGRCAEAGLALSRSAKKGARGLRIAKHWY